MLTFAFVLILSPSQGHTHARAHTVDIDFACVHLKTRPVMFVAPSVWKDTC